MNISEATPTPTQNPRNAFPAWRLRNGLTNATNDELEKSADSCEFWGWLSVAILGGGLLAEIAIAAFHPPYDSFWEQWGTSIANSLVFLGVAGEVQFGWMASRRQAELRRRSDIKIAEAELETERLKAEFGWRGLSPAQRQKLLAWLPKKLGSVTLEYVLGDIESANFAMLLARGFDAGGWAYWARHSRIP